MTREEAIKSLNDIEKLRGDPENWHLAADYVLCELLTSLGYQDVVDAWEKVEKWYA